MVACESTRQGAGGALTPWEGPPGTSWKLLGRLPWPPRDLQLEVLQGQGLWTGGRGEEWKEGERGEKRRG